jgi:site-specific DNA recombinase
LVTRVALYARVSSEMQMEGFSLDMQLKEMRDFAAKENWTIVREYVEEGFSAKTSDRPQFQMLLRDVRLNLFDGLLVHKLDRLYRNLIELLQFVQMLRQNNITLVSVFERFDFNSIAGEMVLSLMGGLSEVYVRNLREETMKGKHGRVLKGLWNGSFPFDYCRGKCSECNDPNGKDYCPDFGQPDKVNGKHLIIHPKDGDGMRLAFALCRTREHSTSTIAQSLNQLGYRTRTKKRFTSDAVCDLLRNPFYAGWVAYKGEQHQGLHPALRW